MALLKRVNVFHREKLITVVISLFLFGVYINQLENFSAEVVNEQRTSSIFDKNEPVCKILYQRYNAAEDSRTTNLGFPKENYNDNIVLVIVVCPPPKQTGPRDEAVVLLKSVIISAKLNKVKNIEIFIFLENVTRESEFLMEKLKEMGYPFDFVNLIINFKSANDAVPKQYRKQFIKGADNKKLLRCTNVRLFFTSALPQVDSILYLDTDVLVHGNLANLWNIWKLMDNQQLVGVSTDYEGNYGEIWFKDVLYPPPRGLNAGILFMNLTKMREYDWQEKLLQLWKTYSITLPKCNDQILINILLYFNTDLLFRLPCHFNFMEQHCISNSPCTTADKCGVQLIHASDNRFGVPGPFKNLHSAYSQINITNFDSSSIENFKMELKTSYEHFYNISKPPSYKIRRKAVVQCHSVLHQLI